LGQKLLEDGPEEILQRRVQNPLPAVYDENQM
jgi:hypothetical protein